MEVAIKNFFKNLDVRFKTIFVSVVVFLFLAHGMAVFNKYSIYDDILFLFDVGNTTTLGRWGLGVLRELTGFFFGRFSGSSVYSLPLMHIFYIVIFLSIALFLMVKLLDIQNLISCVILSGLFIVSPFFIVLFAYVYTSGFYVFSLFLSVFGTYLICKQRTRKYFCIGSVCMMFSLSIYQAFFPVSLSLMTIFFIKNIVDKKDITTKSFIKEGFYYVFACVFVLVLYFISVKLSLLYSNSELFSYKGISNMGKQGIITYLKFIPYAYFRFFCPSHFFIFNTIWLYRIELVVVSLLVFYKSIELYRTDSSKFYQFILLNLLLPLSINFIYVMTVDKDPTYLMLLAYLMVFFYLLFLFENIEEKNIEKFKKIGYTGLFLIVFMFVRWANVFYLSAEFIQARRKNYFVSLVSQIKNTEGYKDEYPVVFLNEFNKKDKNIESLPFPKYILFVYPDTLSLLNSYIWREDLNKWLAYKPQYEKPEKFENLPEVKSMPHYPDYGSIKIINKTVVVKF